MEATAKAGTPSEGLGECEWERSAAAFEREWLAASSALDRLPLDLSERFHLQLPLGDPLAVSLLAPAPAASVSASASAHSPAPSFTLHHVLSALAALPLPPSQQQQPATSAAGPRCTGLAGSGECDALGAQRFGAQMQSAQQLQLASLCFPASQAPSSSTSTRPSTPPPAPTPTHVPDLLPTWQSQLSPAGTAHRHQVCVRSCVL